MILLASGSPRRSEILSREHIPFHVFVPDIEEMLNDTLPIPEQIMDIAKQKAMVAYKEYPNETILAADTVVVLSDKIFGKPHVEQEATNMLNALSGHTHEVITAFCVIKNGDVITDYDTTYITFKKLTDAEIKTYVDSKEPLDRAGAYAIQGGAASFVSEINGDYDNVVGLPITKIKQYL